MFSESVLANSFLMPDCLQFITYKPEFLMELKLKFQLQNIICLLT